MSAKREKKTAIPYIIPMKEMIVTRNKSAQLRRQQDSSTQSNLKKRVINKTERKQKKEGNKKKTKKDKDQGGPIEYYPEKQRRRATRNKIVLKPKCTLKAVITLDEFKKRKPVSPKKQEQLIRFVEDLSLNDIADIKSANVISPDKHKPENCMPADKLKDLSMEEVIVVEDESDELTEEDLMEIITCPSPVWWEEPFDDFYIEEEDQHADSCMMLDSHTHDDTEVGDVSDPNDVSRNSTASRVTENESDNLDNASITRIITDPNDTLTLTRTKPESNTANSISRVEGTELDIYGYSVKRDRTFLKKRTALENLLCNLKRNVTVGSDSEKKEVDSKSRPVDKARKAKPSKKISPKEFLPRVPLDVLNDLENFEIPMAKSTKRDLWKSDECIVIDDDEEDIDGEKSPEDHPTVEPYNKLDNVPQTNMTGFVEKDFVERQHVIDTSFDEEIDSSILTTENHETNTNIKEKHENLKPTKQRLNVVTLKVGKSDDVEKDSKRVGVNEKFKGAKTTDADASVQKITNRKIFIKKNATVKPNSISGIAHSFFGNVVIPHSKNLDTSRKSLLLPLKKVLFNNVNRNCPTSAVDQPPKLKVDEVKSTVHSFLRNNNSKPAEISPQKTEDGTASRTEPKGTEPIINGTSAASEDERLQRTTNRPRETTCDVHAEIQVVNGDDLEISKTETSHMITAAYIKFLKQDKNMKFDRSVLVTNKDRDAELTRSRPECTNGSPKSNEAPIRSTGENMNKPLSRTVNSFNITKVDMDFLLKDGKVIKKNSTVPLAVPQTATKSANLKEDTKSDTKLRYESVALKTILEKPLNDFKSTQNDSSNRKRPHMENVKWIAKKPNRDTFVSDTDFNKPKTVRKIVDFQILEVPKVTTSLCESKGDSTKQLIECENCKFRFKSIAVSKRTVVKYCYKCSSIFNTTNCDYCSKSVDGPTLRQTYSCPRCRHSCCCVQNLARHLRSHTDEQNSETPG